MWVGVQLTFTLAAIAQNLRRLAKLVARPPPMVPRSAALAARGLRSRLAAARNLARGQRTTRLATIASALAIVVDKAALSSGCKSHPATAPAGSNRSSYGGNEVAEAFGMRVTNW